MGNTNNNDKNDYRFRLALAGLVVILATVFAFQFRPGPPQQESPEVNLPPKEDSIETVFAPEVGEPAWNDVWLLSRMVAAEAEAEPYEGQVAVAAVIINRVRNPRFPATVSGVLFEPWAFEPVMNGTFWTVPVTEENIRAAEQALNGWDPTYGSLFFWNPATSTSPWIWTRRIVVGIGGHVFGL